MNSESKCVRDMLIYIKLSLLYADSGSKKKRKKEIHFGKQLALSQLEQFN